LKLISKYFSFNHTLIYATHIHFLFLENLTYIELFMIITLKIQQQFTFSPLDIYLNFPINRLLFTLIPKLLFSIFIFATLG